MNKEVRFPIAKLLKEKGFDENCSDYYTTLGNLNSDGWGDIIFEQGFSSGEPERMLRFNYSDFNKHQKETCFLCPTIADVVMWLYEKHGIWISVNATEDLKSFWYEIHLDAIKSEIYGGGSIWYTGKNCNSPTEAYEAAFEHTLNNLI